MRVVTSCWKGVALALLVFCPLPSTAEYVTDKLVAGLYAEPDRESALLKALPSGTPLEVLGGRGKFRRVRTGDNLEGWIDRDYLTGEKTARIMLLELQATTGELKNRLRRAESELATLRKAPADEQAGTGQVASETGVAPGKPSFEDAVGKYLLTAIVSLGLGFFAGHRFRSRQAAEAPGNPV